MVMDASALGTRFPRLFHMAEDGSWESIQKHGLLSTSGLLDLYGLRGVQRTSIEEQHRPMSVAIKRDGLPAAVIRDQKPMSDTGLSKCLPQDITPRDWYCLLNQMSFFWLSEERLLRLLKARPYRDDTHTVLVVNTASLVRTHEPNIRLSPINSGCTKPYPHPRGHSTFLPVTDYPFNEWYEKRGGRDPIVELAVIGGVSDIAAHTMSVLRMRGSKVVDEVPTGN